MSSRMFRKFRRKSRKESDLIIHDASRDDIFDGYMIGATLGQGGFSVVKECKSNTSQEMLAVKIIKKKDVTPSQAEMLKLEVSILQHVKHKSIIHLHETYESDRFIYMIMELVTGGELFERVVNCGNFCEAQASKITSSVLDATRYLHSCNIIHRDLKPENLLCSTNRSDTKVKIADFGLAAIYEPPLTQACGTPGYVAPEVLLQHPEGYAHEVDLWSIGVIVYILLCGFPPFYAESTTDLLDAIMDGSFDFPSPEWDEISDSAKDLIKKLLVVNPKDRYAASSALEHPWIVDNASAPVRKVRPKLVKEVSF